MLMVIALGGNALLSRGEAPNATNQLRNVQVAAKPIAKLIQAGHQVVLCHGNGPQIGLLARQAEEFKEIPPYPFDVLSAESQSMIGYMLQQALQNELGVANVVTVITQVSVDEKDLAFQNPTKFIGAQYPQDQSAHLVAKNNWVMAKEGDKIRRVIASPAPIDIIELKPIIQLIEKKFTVICAGGGGIPVIIKNNLLQGVDAVIDKDMTAALLAEKLDADLLVIITDVDGVYEDWETASKKLIKLASSQTLKDFKFASGSMQPKVNAAVQFVERTHKKAIIGALSKLELVVEGESGTQVNAFTQGLQYWGVE